MFSINLNSLLQHFTLKLFIKHHKTQWWCWKKMALTRFNLTFPEACDIPGNVIECFLLSWSGEAKINFSVTLPCWVPLIVVKILKRGEMAQFVHIPPDAEYLECGDWRLESARCEGVMWVISGVIWSTISFLLSSFAVLYLAKNALTKTSNWHYLFSRDFRIYEFTPQIAYRFIF